MQAVNHWGGESGKMSIRMSLKTVLRDCVVMLCGTVLGILLAQGFMTNHKAQSISHLTKRGQQSAHVQSLTTDSTSTSFAAIVTDSESLPTRRPNTLAKEMKISTLKPLYIGVITTQNLLPTRAATINQTWGEKAPKLEFFSSANNSLALPVVSLDGVDDTYPPQKKVYRMLKYMHDHYINEYSWFMHADDDVYVRVEHLIHFLSKLDPTKMLYIGQPGGGKSQNLERIKLSMGGPGVVIFSRALLMELAPHLEDCVAHKVVSLNEDLEVGRCISRRLGVQCTWNYEMSQLFMNDYSKGEIFKTTNVYNNQKLLNALTVHSFKDPNMMERIHQFYIEVAINSSMSRTQELKRDLEKVSSYTKRDRAFA